MQLRTGSGSRQWQAGCGALCEITCVLRFARNEVNTLHPGDSLSFSSLRMSRVVTFAISQLSCQAF